MKSVIEEASSLEKAIEQGWIKAGKPKEFSVKIFQEPIKNFLGMSKQTAKIGIFFKESSHSADSTGSPNYQDRNRSQQRRPYRGNRPNNAAANANNPNYPANKNRRPQPSTPGSQINGTANNPTNDSTVHKEANAARTDGVPAPKRYHRPRRPYQGNKQNTTATANNQPNYAGHDENLKKD